MSQDIDIIDDHNEEWVDDRSKPDIEFDDEQQPSYEQNLTNLCVFQWLGGVILNMCYVMFCVMLLRSWVRRS